MVGNNGVLSKVKVIVLWSEKFSTLSCTCQFFRTVGSLEVRVISMEEVKLREFLKVGKVPIFSIFSACFIMSSSRRSPLGLFILGVGPHILLWAFESAHIRRPYLFCLE